MKNNNLYILCVLLLSSCGDSGTVTTDEPTPDTAIGLTLSKITATTSSSGESDTFTVKLKTKDTQTGAWAPDPDESFRYTFA